MGVSATIKKMPAPHNGEVLEIITDTEHQTMALKENRDPDRTMPMPAERLYHWTLGNFDVPGHMEAGGSKELTAPEAIRISLHGGSTGFAPLIPVFEQAIKAIREHEERKKMGS